ncbi:alpha/beta fold hydrolase [Variovorax sp. PvP013]|uniref:alpha/beta fold hydrolase n=1 Tax=Variovorax sp. PvP013 TaxID=3156435 RepID=UPI003D231572
MAHETLFVAYGTGEEAVRIEVIAQGRGPAIVVLPSLGRDGYEDYDATAAHLAADGWRVLRPQPRGVGGSTGPMHDVLLPALARDVAEVVVRLDAAPAVLVGHAYGNYVARMTAVAHPEVVRGVVLAAAAARDVPLAVRAAPGIAGDATRSDAERLAALRLAFFAPGHDATAWLHGWYPATQALQAASSRGAVTPDVWWHAGDAPLLELIPADDPFKPADQWTQLRDEFGAARVTTRVVDAASHALFPEQPAAVARAIGDWARALPPVVGR